MCNGKIDTNLVCDCYTHNCCDAVSGEEIDENCPHKVWVICYRAEFVRTFRVVCLKDVENFERGE